MAHPLDDPRAKIGRAETHLAELDAERQKWVDSHPYAILDYARENKTVWAFAVHRFDEEVKPESDIFGLIIGDYVHALRSALDQLVWQLVTVANKKRLSKEDERRIAFPIITTHPTDFWSLTTVKNLTLEQALMLEGFQPYRAIGSGHDHPLSHLHVLWNTDKHKLVPILKVTVHKNGPVFRYTDCEPVEPKWDSDVALEGDTEFAWVTVRHTGPEPKVDVEWLPVDVAFGGTGRLIQDLPVMRDIVRDIVNNCAHFFK